ncbi:MAG: hypothetical protein HKUEN01_31070 [Candidatus Kuenenia stuttgartiensis]|nr:MAG: hypothetical protein HKUEN01_31070 [Candidatus Kuenenia stuttgartiensis]
MCYCFFSICKIGCFLSKSNIPPGKVKLTRIYQCDIKWMLGAEYRQKDYVTAEAENNNKFVTL